MACGMPAAHTHWPGSHHPHTAGPSPARPRPHHAPPARVRHVCAGPTAAAAAASEAVAATHGHTTCPDPSCSLQAHRPPGELAGPSTLQGCASAWCVTCVARACACAGSDALHSRVVPPPRRPSPRRPAARPAAPAAHRDASRSHPASVAGVARLAGFAVRAMLGGGGAPPPHPQHSLGAEI